MVSFSKEITVIEVYPNLFVGSEYDIHAFSLLAEKRTIEKCPAVVSSYISAHYVQAAKEPFHREAVKYVTRGAPKDHPEYLVARRSNRIILNLVDVPESKAQYIPDEALDAAVDYIQWCVHSQFKPILVHCNQGVSRGPSIALMFLMKHTNFAEGLSLFESVEDKFRTLYPAYNPQGIRVKTRERFEALK